MNRLLLTLFSLVGISASTIMLNSCAKDKDNHRLTVVVTANDSVRVANATVHLYVPVSNTYIEGWYDQTNESGETEYAFGNKVVVELTATKGSFKGCSFAEVERGDNTVFVNMLPYAERAENGCFDSGS